MKNHDAVAAREPHTTPDTLGMDYAFLRKTGIEHIQRLAGTLWTDHNTHDPGITLLECLCYAITDVSYRLSFDMEDLLAVPSHPANATSSRSPAPLFTARDILTSHPLTINDYRKLLIDISGVRNAWIEKSPSLSVPIYYETESNCLSFYPAKTESLPIRGVYQVYIAKDDTVLDGETEKALMETVKTRLHQYRNIAEDFADPILLPFEEITVKLKVVVADDVNLDHLAAHIYLALSQAIAPTIPFYSLNARRQENRPVDTIFEGPPLANGFIDDTELEGFDRKNTLRSSDLIQVILDMSGVQSVKEISLESSQKKGVYQSWVLELDLNYTPKLKPLLQMLESDLQFERQGILCRINVDATKERLKELKKSNKKEDPPQDIPLPRGRYRHLDDYTSIQHDLPPNYGLGRLGLPDSASDERKVQAKQLKAYLLFFDQLLANYLAQLAHIRTLFCPPTIGETPPRSIQTYFTQPLIDVPELDSVLNTDRATYEAHLQKIIEPADTKITRENSLLNHLMARFGEQFVDYSLLLYDKQQHRKPVMTLDENNPLDWRGFYLEDKLAFLHAYPQMSAARGSAFNYTKKSWDTDNIAGLKRRLCGLLGIKAVNTATIKDEGFHLVEHLLLRPRALPTETKNTYWALGSSIDRFSQSTQLSNRTVCHATDHGLQPGDHITIFDTTDYNGRYEVKQVSADSFGIEQDFVAEEAKKGRWIMNNAQQDPYSFQLSFIFPDWPERFKEKNFQKLLYDTLINETPAHVMIYVHWFNQTTLQAFETVYQTWLTKMATDPASAWPESIQLLAQLRMGKALTI